MTTPARTTEQRTTALQKANRIRVHRARLKEDVKAGKTPAPPLILHPDAMVDSMKVYDLLLAMPKVGRVKANRMLSRARVSPSKTLGGLSDRQRQELLAFLPHRWVA